MGLDCSTGAVPFASSWNSRRYVSWLSACRRVGLESHRPRAISIGDRAMARWPWKYVGREQRRRSIKIEVAPAFRGGYPEIVEADVPVGAAIGFDAVTRALGGELAEFHGVRLHLLRSNSGGLHRIDKIGFVQIDQRQENVIRAQWQEAHASEKVNGG